MADWFGEWVEYLKNLLVMILLAAAVFLIYLISAPLLLIRWVAGHLSWLLMAAGLVAFFTVWFWIIANYGFEGNGSGELLRMTKEAMR